MIQQGKKLDARQIDTMARLLRQGWSSRAVAVRCSCSRMTVFRYRKQLGLSANKLDQQDGEA